MEKSKLYYVWVIILVLAFPAFFGIFVAVLFGVQLLVPINRTRRLHAPCRSIHIAVSRNGIYIDECDDANQTLMLRTIIKHENIHDVSITSYSYVSNYRYFEAKY